MRSIAWLLSAIALVMLVVLVHRFTETGGPGPKTWAFAVLTIIVIIAAVVQWRRATAAPEPRVPPAT